MVSLKIIHASNIILTKQVIFWNTYVYTYMCTIAISEKGHGFEGKIGGVNRRRFWSEEREGENVVI